MDSYRIALLGDSMTARWGDDCPELAQELARQYPQSAYAFENHGLDESRAGYALWRISNDYEAGGRRRHSLSLFDPHIAIVESFAYSNRADGPEGLSEYRDVLRRIVDEIRHTTTAQVVFMLTLPPHRERFMENVPNFLHTSKATRQRFADDVKLYLDEARRIAQDEGWPLADVCAEVEKRVETGENMRHFINQSDNLHPSRYGYFVAARVITRTIDNHRMIEDKVQH